MEPFWFIVAIVVTLPSVQEEEKEAALGAPACA